MNMITGTITKEQLTSLSSRCNSEDCARIEKGFIGPDGEHHNYEYDKSDYQWHSHITKEEWMKKNNSSQLEYCQKKCPLWERCRHQEYTILTMDGVTEKLSDDIAKEIDKRIVEDLLKERKL